ncbi:MAG: cellulose biosynthesis cyclic di-GMP-binding regulatory protein BcsB [Anaerolineae bacterium]|nr:cellulose biosynthesis cyclic di-GMP-binding regulatory protein BcsB [Anaerolineae bacterium]
MYKRFLLACSLAFAFVLLANLVARGETNTRTLTFADLGYPKDETLHGVRATREYGVLLPQSWNVQTATILVLRFSHSPALRPNSSLAVDWNGTRLTSTLLTAENAKDGVLRAEIPAALMRTGYNVLRLEAYMGIQDDFCSDIDNPAVWLTVHHSSFLQVNFLTKSPEADLGTFPLPFIEPSSLVTNTVTLVLPDSPRLAELTAAATIGAKLGQLAAWRPLQFDVRAASTFDLNQNNGHIIVIGARERLPRTLDLPIVKKLGTETQLTDWRGEPLPRHAGVLWEQLTPRREALLLVVTGEDDTAMLTAARALASTPTYAQLNGPLGVVLQVPPPKGNGSIGQTLTLEELGYRDITAQGSREQTLNYVIPLPMAWQIQEGATLDLHFAHSALLDTNKSSLNVLLNGTPVGSILLTSKTASDGRVTFTLPARLFKMGENTLTIVSNIQVPRPTKDPTDCLNTYYREAWLVVYADSRLRMPGAPANLSATLGNYPRAFIGAMDLSDLTFVVPPEPNLAVARAVAWISARLGRFAQGETLAPLVADAQTPTLTRYQIIVGRPSQNPAIAKLKDVLPQPFKSNSDEPEPVAQVAQVLPPRGTIGYVQATTIDKQPRLVVTGNNDEGLLWAAEALSAPELLGKLRGDLAILSAAASLTTLEVRTKDNPTALALAQPTPTTNGTSSMPTWVMGLTIGLFLVTAVILFLVGWQSWIGMRMQRRRNN